MGSVITYGLWHAMGSVITYGSWHAMGSVIMYGLWHAIMSQRVLSTLGSATSICCTAKWAENSLLHSKRVANCATSHL